MTQGGREHRPGRATRTAEPYVEEPTYVPRAVNAGAELRARIQRRADSTPGPKRDGIERVPQRDDPAHEYQHDAMHPGPLSDKSVYDPRNEGKSLPAQGFYGGKYDEDALKQDKVLYRVGPADAQWGQWFTEEPIKSEAQFRVDLAVKPWWTGADGKVESRQGRAPKSMPEVLYTVLIPKGTKIYPGPVGGQGDAHMGGLQMKQVFVPKPWSIPGAKILSKQPFARSGDRGEHR